MGNIPREYKNLIYASVEASNRAYEFVTFINISIGLCTNEEDIL